MSRVRLRLKRIEQYVLTRTLSAIGAAVGMLASMIVLIDFVELSRNVGTRAKDASVADVFGLALLDLPSKVLLLLPFAFLFGVLGAFVNLNRRSELIAMRAAGVSAWRFIFPAAGAAVVIGLVSVTAFNPIASALSDQYQRVQQRLLQTTATPQDKAIWLRQGDARSQMIIRAKSNQGPGVKLNDVSMFVYALDRTGSARFAMRIDAKSAQLVNGQWRLDQAREARPGGEAETFASLTLPSTLNERTALERFTSAQAVPFWSLPGMIMRTERAGFSATLYRLQFQQLLATPLMYAAMSVLAAAFSLRLLRLGGLGALAGAGVGLGFVLFFLDQLCNALGKAEVIPPSLAAWTPPLLAILAGFTLLCYTEDG